MNMHGQESREDERPGISGDLRTNLLKYTGGLLMSIILTLVAFWVSETGSIWPGGVPVLLASLAIAQMGVHLLMFLHVSSGPEGTNNILSLAFGVFVVGLLIFGSMIIMHSLDARMNDTPVDAHGMTMAARRWGGTLE